jgi:hypothetical protein
MTENRRKKQRQSDRIRVLAHLFDFGLLAEMEQNLRRKGVGSADLAPFFKIKENGGGQK